MSEIKIRDGTGSGRTAGVDLDNRLEVHAVTSSETVDAAICTRAYNLNTGDITLTDENESTIMFFRNNEDNDFIMTALAIGVGTLPNPTESTVVTMIRNPTAASFSTAISMNQNRNFGAAQTLSADIYKGAQGASLTGGNAIAQFYMTGGSRLFAGIDFDIPRGTTIGLNIQLNDTTGGVVYAAIIGYVRGSG